MSLCFLTEEEQEETRCGVVFAGCARKLSVASEFFGVSAHFYATLTARGKADRRHEARRICSLYYRIMGERLLFYYETRRLCIITEYKYMFVFKLIASLCNTKFHNLDYSKFEKFGIILYQNILF